MKKHKILLTGASAGIGRSIAEALTIRGYDVWGTSRDLRRIEATPHLHPLTLDLSNETSIADAVRQAEQESGGIDVLINNAGSGHFGDLEVMDPEIIRRQIDLLAIAPLRLIQSVLPHMKSRRRGLIINITSLSVQFPIPYMASYSAGKSALSALTQSLQLELSGSPVRVVEVQPGDIRTDFNEAMGASENWSRRARLTRAKIDRDMAAAPSPSLVSNLLVELIESKSPPPRVMVGDFFQAAIAPLAKRLFPDPWMRWGIRKYYGL